MPTSAVPSLAPRRATLRYLSCLRTIEILVLQGPPVLGAAFALRPPIHEHMAALATLTLANVCLVAHVFAVNDWANLGADLADPDKTAGVFTAHGVERHEMGLLAIGLLAGALLLASVLGPTALALAAGVAVASALYSLPWFDGKGTPFLNSALHLAGGALHFLLGYAVGGRLDGRGVAIGLFFALIFAAGHLTQEIRDHRGDVHNAIRTNAVAFGPRRTFAASLVLFALAHAVLLVLAWRGIVPGVLGVLALFFAIHVRWSLDTLDEGLSYSSITRLQARYRVLYGIAGLAMIATLWMT